MRRKIFLSGTISFNREGATGGRVVISSKKPFKEVARGKQEARSLFIPRVIKRIQRVLHLTDQEVEDIEVIIEDNQMSFNKKKKRENVRNRYFGACSY